MAMPLASEAMGLALYEGISLTYSGREGIEISLYQLGGRHRNSLGAQ